MNKALIALLLGLSIQPAFALQPGPEGETGPHHGRFLERMATELQLNADQRAKVQAIFQARREKQQALHAETRARLQEVLTPEQMAKLDAMRQQRFARHHGGGHGDAPGPRPW